MERKRKDYAKEAVRARIGRDIPEALRDLYVDQRHTQEAIADAFGISRTLLRDWMAEYGITRDDRPAVAL